MSISQKIHAAYESALIDAGVNYSKILCSVCRSCKVCGLRRTRSNPTNAYGTDSMVVVSLPTPSSTTPFSSSKSKNKNSRHKHKYQQQDRSIENEHYGDDDDHDNDDNEAPVLTIHNLRVELQSTLERVDTLSALNLQAFEDLANEKNKFIKLNTKYEELRHQFSSLQKQEQLYLKQITKLQSSLKLSEACRSQTTKEMRKSKREFQLLQKEIVEVKCQTTLTSLERNPRNIIIDFNQFSSDNHEKSQQILVTVQHDMKELIQLISRWNSSLESIFMTQPNNEQEWLGLLNSLCISVVERLVMVHDLLEKE